MTKKLRAPFRWYGGKGQLRGKILPRIPTNGKVYVEPYAGAASLFFARKHAPVEVLNDLDGDIVNLFRVLQDPEQFELFKHRARFTLYARAELERAIETLKDPNASAIDRAWAFFVSVNQGFGGKKAKSGGDWGRTRCCGGGVATTTNSWVMRLALLDDWHARLLTAQIDNRDALEAILYWDGVDTVFYVDPPYVLSTRGTTRAYAAEQDDDHHYALVETLLRCEGAVVLSGYEHAIYEPLLAAGWRLERFRTSCHAAGRTRNSGLQGDGAATKKAPRTECLWINPRALEMLREAQTCCNSTV